MSIIKVKGSGEIKVKPDIIEFRINFNVIDKKYDMAINNEIDKIDSFFQILSNNEIDKEKFKTLNYSVKPYYETKETGIIEKKNEQVFAGYQVSRNGILEIKLDFQLMEKLIYEFEKLGAKVTYQFGISDKEASKKEAMKQAYSNAYEKAFLLAEVSNMQLDGYEEISYEVPISYNTYSETAYFKGAMMNKEMSIGNLADTFNINDIVIKENIYVVWRVK